MKKYICELIGTCVLVLVGCGVAVLTGDIVATAFAFGLSVVAMAYSVGTISGGHFNPAITTGMLINKRIKGREACYYIISQILGALCGSLLLFIFLKCSNLHSIGSMGANGYGTASSVGLNCLGAILVEIVLTFIFVFTALFASADKNNKASGLIIGLALVLVHLIGISLTGTSVNPARSLSAAIFQAGDALAQVWVFIVAPTIGAIIAGYTYKGLK
jgi:aquaporin Z